MWNYCDKSIVGTLVSWRFFPLYSGGLVTVNLTVSIICCQNSNSISDNTFIFTHLISSAIPSYFQHHLRESRTQNPSSITFLTNYSTNKVHLEIYLQLSTHYNHHAKISPSALVNGLLLTSSPMIFSQTHTLIYSVMAWNNFKKKKKKKNEDLTWHLHLNSMPWEHIQSHWSQWVGLLDEWLLVYSTFCITVWMSNICYLNSLWVDVTRNHVQRRRGKQWYQWHQ